MTRFSLLFVTAGLVVISVFSIQATIISVPADQPTIQAGIDAAIPGDTVLVADGTYTGAGNRDIDFGGKGILLKSVNGPDVTTIDCQGTEADAHRGFSFHSGEDSSAVIDGFTIQGGFSLSDGSFDGSPGLSAGGGIKCDSASSPMITNNRITGNSGVPFSYGGGIACLNYSNPTISNNIISGNSIRFGLGGGIAILFNSNPTISDNSIEGNSVRLGGGMYCLFNSHPTIRNNNIRENSAINGGGIACEDNSNPTISKNNINHNLTKSGKGGGISCSDSNPRISNNIITANLGSGISCANSSPDIVNTIIWSNAGIQIDTIASSKPLITYCDIQGGWEGQGNISADPRLVVPFNGNVCSQSPCIDAGEPSILDPDGSRSDIGLFFPDHPECSVGNVNIWYVSTGGSDNAGDGTSGNPFRTIRHAIDLSFSGDTIVVRNGTYVENIIVPGKSIVLTSNYLFSEDSLDIANTVIDGGSAFTVITLVASGSLSAITGFTIRNGGDGGIYCFNNSNPTISHNSIRGNRANRSAGGIFCDESSPTIMNNTISGNSVSGGAGGGISCVSNSNPAINDNTINDNSAIEGGGVYCNKSNPTIQSNIINNNSAVEGGGIYCEFNSSPTIDGNTIRGNSADEGGGIACEEDSNPIISNNTIADNSALNGGGIYCGDSDPIISTNDIIDNTSGGGIVCGDSDPTIVNNLISGNSGRGIICVNSSPLISNCTIVSNPRGGVYLANNSAPSFVNSIIVFNYNLGAVYCEDDNSPTFSCCNIFGNVGGDWAHCITGLDENNSNFSADPMFCDTSTGNYQIESFSPCAAQFNSCGVLIGALEIGCESFICADANGDTKVTLDDLDFLIAFYFAFGPSPDPDVVSDLNCSGAVDLADIVLLAQYLNGEEPQLCCLSGSPGRPGFDHKKKPEGIGVGPTGY